VTGWPHSIPDGGRLEEMSGTDIQLVAFDNRFRNHCGHVHHFGTKKPLDFLVVFSHTDFVHLRSGLVVRVRGAFELFWVRHSLIPFSGFFQETFLFRPLTTPMPVWLESGEIFLEARTNFLESIRWSG
jgi:hypothetical protein